MDASIPLLPIQTNNDGADSGAGSPALEYPEEDGAD